MQTLIHALHLLWAKKRTESSRLQTAGLTLFGKSVKHRLPGLVLGNYGSVRETLAASPWT